MLWFVVLVVSVLVALAGIPIRIAALRAYGRTVEDVVRVYMEETAPPSSIVPAPAYFPAPAYRRRRASRDHRAARPAALRAEALRAIARRAESLQNRPPWAAVAGEKEEPPQLVVPKYSGSRLATFANIGGIVGAVVAIIALVLGR